MTEASRRRARARLEATPLGKCVRCGRLLRPGTAYKSNVTVEGRRGIAHVWCPTEAVAPTDVPPPVPLATKRYAKSTVPIPPPAPPRMDADTRRRLATFGPPIYTIRMTRRKYTAYRKNLDAAGLKDLDAMRRAGILIVD